MPKLRSERVCIYGIEFHQVGRIHDGQFGNHSSAEVEVGRIYEGKVARLMDFGAFVTISPGKDGLVHVSQISNDRVEKVSDVLKEGDIVKVKVLEVDKQGRIRLSMKAVEEGEGVPAA